MSYDVDRESFSPDDLEIVPETGREVILASGGVVMLLETIEGENGLCSWRGDDKQERHLFPLVCLRRVVRIAAADFPDLRG